MDEFQEADILWPDTAPRDEMVPFAPMEEPYEAAGSASSGAPALGRRFTGSFLPGADPPSSSSSAGASLDADDDAEEWQEADVLWPETVDVQPRGAGGGLLWPFPGGFRRAGRHVKPAAARREGWRTGPAASSPIDIPATVAARRRLGAAMDDR